MRKYLSLCGVALLLAAALFIQPQIPEGNGSMPAAAAQTMPQPCTAMPVSETSIPPQSAAPTFAFTPAPTVPTAPAASSSTPAGTPTPSSAATPEPTPAPAKAPQPSRAPKKPGKVKKAYLTFDDGPVLKGKKKTNGTANLLKILKKHGIKATFFLLGRSVQAYPALAKRIAADGHALGNHTWSHVDAQEVSSGEFAWQVKHTNDVIEKVTGVRPKAFRPPYGKHLSGAQWGALKRNGLKAYWWNVDTRDWAGSTDKQILGYIAYNVRTNKDDLIILFHDHSFSALEEAIDMLERHGYVFDTLDHIR